MAAKCKLEADGKGRAGGQSRSPGRMHMYYTKTQSAAIVRRLMGENGWAQMRRPRRPEAAPVGAVGLAAQPQAGQRTGRRVGM